MVFYFSKIALCFHCVALEVLYSEIYPQSGPNCVIVVVDTATAVADGAEEVDICSVVRITAGRPQPPPTISIAVFVCSLRIAISGSLTLTRTVRTKVLLYLGNAEEEYFVGRIVAG